MPEIAPQQSGGDDHGRWRHHPRRAVRVDLDRALELGDDPLVLASSRRRILGGGTAGSRARAGRIGVRLGCLVDGAAASIAGAVTSAVAAPC